MIRFQMIFNDHIPDDISDDDNGVTDDSDNDDSYDNDLDNNYDDDSNDKQTMNAHGGVFRSCFR